MKKTKIFIVSILVLAISCAYASSQNRGTIQAYYIDDNGGCPPCQEVDCVIGGTGCLCETPLGLRQAYASNIPSGGLPCSEPLKEED